jgi:hypothetical protein
MKQTQQQRANTLDALNNMWPSVPYENVAEKLMYWRTWKEFGNVPDCGSVACFGGWCAWWPAFRAQGVIMGAYGSPRLKNEQDYNNYDDYDHEIDTRHICMKLFGVMALFNARDYFIADRNFKGTDHELVLHRLQWVLDNTQVE